MTELYILCFLILHMTKRFIYSMRIAKDIAVPPSHDFGRLMELQTGGRTMKKVMDAMFLSTPFVGGLVGPLDEKSDPD